jgi:hypothetical protein
MDKRRPMAACRHRTAHPSGNVRARFGLAPPCLECPFPIPDNAVRIQLFTALIAFLVLRAAQACQSAVAEPLKFVHLIRFNRMHERSITSLIQPEIPPPIGTRQIALEFAQC